MWKNKHIPFRHRPLTKAVNNFIRTLNPDQHYLNCYRVEAIWFYDNHNWFKVYYSQGNFSWAIIHIFDNDEGGRCNNFRQLKKIVLDKIKDIRKKELFDVKD